MVRHATDPLTVAEAKQALRQSAQAAKPQHLITEHPASLLALAFSFGLIAGNPKSRRIAIAVLEPLLLRYLTQRRRRNNLKSSNDL
jgi:hypothetical protein